MQKAVVVKHFGTSKAVADALGVGKAAISKWGEVVPQRYQYELERLTRGKFRATWPPADRPRMKAAVSKLRR